MYRYKHLTISTFQVHKRKTRGTVKNHSDEAKNGPADCMVLSKEENVLKPQVLFLVKGKHTCVPIAKLSLKLALIIRKFSSHATVYSQ